MSDFIVRTALTNLNGSKRFEVGDEVELFIALSVQKKFVCDGMYFKTGWKTRGKGIEEQGEPFQFSIPGETYKAGEYQLRKSFTIQPGPATFHGYAINIEWSLDLEIYGPEALLLVAKKIEFSVQEKPYSEPLPVHSPLFNRLKEGKTTSSFARKFVSIFIPLSLVAVIYFGMSNGSPKLALIPGFLLSVFIVYLVKRKPKKQPFNNFQFDVDTYTLHAGQPLNVGISFDAGVSVPIKSIDVHLIGYEISHRQNKDVSSDGPPIIVEEKESFRKYFELSGPVNTIKNQLNRTSKTITIPPDLPASFKFKFNELKWELVMQLRAEGASDVQKRLNLEIV